MYKLKLKTIYGKETELIVEDYFDEEVQEIINQPYIQEVYMRCIDYENKEDYKGVKRLVKENRNVKNKR